MRRGHAILVTLHQIVNSIQTIGKYIISADVRFGLVR